ncbi:MAG: energy-coupling factor transporter transmembrane protein EcfT [Clostridia bacterium]|nr:energy-coupling factor transporter transmembrane protein EcfT [Clostridia bacterium]
MGVFQYSARSTPLHRLHPIVKLVYLVLTLVVVIFPYRATLPDLVAVAYWALVSLALWATARVGLRQFGFLMRVLLWTFGFIMISQALLYEGGHVVFSLGRLAFFGSDIGSVTDEGLFWGVVLSLRILAAALALPLFVVTTSPAEIMGALGQLRVPAKVSFMFVSALSFTGLIFKLWQEILDAQRLRGFDMDAMNAWQRARRAYVPVVTPLILLLFRKGNDFQIAMDARGYAYPGRKTPLVPLRFGATEAAALVAAVGLFLVFVALKETWIRVA